MAERLRVHVIYEHGGDGVPFGCAYIRDLLPLGHPTNSTRIALTAASDYAPADVVVVERTVRTGATVFDAEELLERARRDRARLAYTLDDNLLDAPSLSPASRGVVRLLCREADAVLVATPALAQRLARLARKLVVLPNALDERLFLAEAESSQRRDGGGVCIGYMGTWTHDRDLLLVLQPLRQVLRAYRGSVRLEMVGGADAAILSAFEGLAVRALTVPPPEVEYPRFVRWLRSNARWDVAMAPLEDTPFTRAKSDIKFLDYGVLELATVCSAVPAYTATVQHGVNGLLVANTPDAWAEALARLVEDACLRRRLAGAARAYVTAERTLSRRAPAWADALLALS